MIGAAQNSHNCPTAPPPTKIAGPVLRAGLTEVFVTGMEIRWISVRHIPMAMGAKPLGARSSVEPNITSRKNSESTSSATKHAIKEYPPGEWAPYPFEANPPARLNPSLPLAIRYNTPEPAIPPKTCAEI